MPPAHLLRVARTAGVALLPAVVVFCCAGRASAECGNYVTSIDESGHARPMGHPTDDPAPARTPCHGPNCHGIPEAPAPVPPAPTVTPADAKGLIVDAGGPAGNDLAGRLPNDSDGWPVRHPLSIFHPPRAS